MLTNVVNCLKTKMFKTLDNVHKWCQWMLINVSKCKKINHILTHVGKFTVGQIFLIKGLQNYWKLATFS